MARNAHGGRRQAGGKARPHDGSGDRTTRQEDAPGGPNELRREAQAATRGGGSGGAIRSRLANPRGAGTIPIGCRAGEITRTSADSGAASSNLIFPEADESGRLCSCSCFPFCTALHRLHISPEKVFRAAALSDSSWEYPENIRVQAMSCAKSHWQPVAMSHANRQPRTWICRRMGKIKSQGNFAQARGRSCARWRWLESA